jgi:hypothetical protein
MNKEDIAIIIIILFQKDIHFYGQTDNTEF